MIWRRACGVVGLLLMSAASGTRSAALDEATPAPPALVFDRLEHDAGVVRQGDVIAAEFAFENRGVVPLTLSAPITGCGCAAEIVGAADVAPGDGGHIRFSCDTSQHHGAVRLTATVHSSEIGRRAVVLALRGEVALDVVAEPAAVYLGQVTRNQRKTDAFNMRVGETRTAIRGAGTDGRYIDVERGSDGGGFDVTVRPEAPLGRFTQNVSIATSSERFSVVTVPVTGIVVEELPARRR